MNMFDNGFREQFSIFYNKKKLENTFHKYIKKKNVFWFLFSRT